MLTAYGLRATLNISYEETIEKTKAALQEEGFGVLTEIDVKETLKKRLDVDFRRYLIWGACNPPLAHQALQNELELGLFLPCNVIIYETDDEQVAVAIMAPLMMVELVENKALEAVAQEANARLTRVIEKLSSL